MITWAVAWFAVQVVRAGAEVDFMLGIYVLTGLIDLGIVTVIMLNI